MANLFDQLGAAIKTGVQQGIKNVAAEGVSARLETQWLWPIEVRAAKENPTPGEKASESLGEVFKRVFKPHLVVTGPGGVKLVDAAPAGAPRPYWPLTVAALAGVAVLAIIGARTLLRR